ncbi:hypothetical protein EA227_26560 [Escherichia coli]|nr:hypothetical protein EA227_26560 [Escherichia coli]
MSVDGHGVSGLQHNQNDWLIAYFAPYRWLRFTGVINEKSRVSRRRRGLMDEINDVYCLRYETTITQSAWRRLFWPVL